jgi:hypothetical protein
MKPEKEIQDIAELLSEQISSGETGLISELAAATSNFQPTGGATAAKPDEPIGDLTKVERLALWCKHFAKKMGERSLGGYSAENVIAIYNDINNMAEVLERAKEEAGAAMEQLRLPLGKKRGR